MALQYDFLFTLIKGSKPVYSRCYFFKDYEGIEWHIKAYDVQDKYINI